MGNTDKVLASRDGDRFHYYWAARRALHLPDPNANLMAVGVEGVPQGEEVDGDEVVDVAEYYGGATATSSVNFRHIQLKHSTVRTDKDVIASELGNTLRKFAGIYRGLTQAERSKVSYVFVCNRRLDDEVRTSLSELAAASGAQRTPRP